MTCIIVEDERPAAERLKKMVEQYDPTIEVAALTDSISSTVAYLSSHPHPDFMLMDIQLGDGISFEILEQVAISCPIIFTAAFNEYAIKAFKVNSIDYLLKPIDKDELEAALKRLLGIQAKGDLIKPDNRSMAEQVIVHVQAEIQKLLALPDETLMYLCHDYPSQGRKHCPTTTVAAQKLGNIHVKDGINEAEFVEMRERRDANLEMPRLIIPSVQLNIDGGHFPKPEDNGTRYLKVPINAL